MMIKGDGAYRNRDVGRRAARGRMKFLARRLIVVASVLTAGTALGDDFKSEYKMQVTVGPTTAWGQGAEKFAELVKKKTDGRINIKPYFGSQLLKGDQLHSAQMVSMGAIDLALESTINVAPVIPQMNIFSLPFYVGTFANADKLENGETGKLLFDEMKKKGLMPLAWGENGFRQITNDKKDIRKPGDLSGLKVRVVGSSIFKDIYRKMGASPANMNWGDAVTAFQQGVVDAQENPVGILLPVQIYQYHKHVTMWNYLIDPLVLFWNKKQWEQFPKDIQDAITEAAKEATRFQKALVRVGLDDGTALKILKKEFSYEPEVQDPKAFLKEKGMTVTELSEEEMDAFYEATKPVLEQWKQKLGEEVMRAAESDLKK